MVFSAARSGPSPRIAGLRPRVNCHKTPARHPPRTLAYEVAVAEARERARIACGLHDDIGQLLTLTRLKLGALREASQGPAAALVSELIELVSQAAKATRSVTFDLCSPALELGLQTALNSLADRLACGGAGLSVRLQGELPPLQLCDQVQAVVFRVVRELCLNVQKHAAAGELCIAIGTVDVSLCITVQDDGVGFVPQTSAQRFSRNGGFGLVSAQAQMQALGGRLIVASEPGKGTRATLWLPLPA